MKGAEKRRSIRLGVASCLLGEAVRYDGGHKRDPLVRSLARIAQWVPVCPELEAGLGVPRPPMRLVHDARGVRLVEIASGRDHTRALRRVAAARVRALRALDLSGYVLKANSPSCGIARVPLYTRAGRTRGSGGGLYAQGLREAFPHLPVIDEVQLRDPERRAHFVERALAYARVRALFRGRWTIGDVAAFQTAHVPQLRAHAPARCRELARLLERAPRMARARFRERYTEGFLAALARPVRSGRRRLSP